MKNKEKLEPVEVKQVVFFDDPGPIEMVAITKIGLDGKPKPKKKKKRGQ